DAIFGDMPADTDDHLFDFFQAAFIDQYAPYRRLAHNLGAGRTEAQDVAGFGDNDFLADNGGLLDQCSVPVQLPVGAVNGNEVFWLHQRHYEFQFLFARMTAHMHRRLTSIGVIDVGPPAIKMVHHAPDCALI